jgi:hypothetical protein
MIMSRHKTHLDPETGAPFYPLAHAQHPTGREPLIDVLAALAAAVSLLERTPQAKKAAPSDKMFAQMIADYKAALERGRAALRSPAASEPPPDWKQDQADTSVMPRQTQAEGVSAVELIDWLETETSVFNCSFVAEKLLQKFDVRQK